MIEPLPILGSTGVGTAASGALLPAVAIVLAASVTLFWSPPDVARRAIQHFGAGVVFAAVSVEVVPELLAVRDTVVVVAGFVVGIALMIGLRFVSDALERRSATPGASFWAAVALDVAIDGLLIGVAYTLGDDQGRLVTVALAVEFAALGLALGTTRADPSVRSLLLPVAALGALTVAGAAAGYAVLAGASGAVQGFVMAIGAVVLMYLVTEELLREAHSGRERTWYTGVFFAGFVVIFLLAR